MLLVRHFTALPRRRHCLLGGAILSSTRAGGIGIVGRSTIRGSDKWLPNEEEILGPWGRSWTLLWIGPGVPVVEHAA
jgi:hypothetical protein